MLRRIYACADHVACACVCVCVCVCVRVCVCACVPSFRFNVNDLVWYIGDNNIWPHSNMAIPNRVQLKVVTHFTLFCLLTTASFFVRRVMFIHEGGVSISLRMLNRSL
jgi:hypothetical protein